MSSTFKLIEVVGTSNKSVSDAIDSAIRKAAESVKSIGWFEVGEIRGRVADGKVGEYQVTIKIGFKLED